MLRTIQFHHYSILKLFITGTPGQACCYKIGHSEINRQRQLATSALGPKFDLKAFDDTVVLGGNVPLDVLAKNVDEYVRSINNGG